ncbi:MAG: hypothetical protein KGM91_18145 [Burkholderiales bacterium]|nr:hypothetical protein [Burkholderiales bacterium]
MRPLLAWIGALAWLGAGAVGWGWRGFALAFTVLVTAMMLQVTRIVLVMKAVAGRPLGRVDSVLMLQSRLEAGMKLERVVQLAGSLGRALDEQGMAFAWADAGGDRLVVRLDAGRVASWALERGA